MGMRAATGAVDKVSVSDGRIECHVLGDAEPRGICGSGIVDAVAAGLELGIVRPDGRFSERTGFWEILPPVGMNQADIREVQLAKGAIAAGIRILLSQWGAEPDRVERLYLAGAFGNYISRRSARRIGLLDFPLEKIRPAGNTALLGAKLALFHHAGDGEDFGAILSRTRHVGLSEDPTFEETYVDNMRFP